MSKRIMTHPHISAILKALNSLSLKEREKVYIFINEKDFELVRSFGYRLLDLVTDANVMNKLGIHGTMFGTGLKMNSKEVKPGFFYLIESEEFEMIHAIGREFSFKDY